MFFLKKFIIILSIILFIISYSVVYIYGRENNVDIDISDMRNVSIKYDEEFLICNKTINNDSIHLDILAKRTGKTEIIVEGDKDYKGTTNSKQVIIDVYVHKNGVITISSFFGYCNGDISFVISSYIILILIIIYLIDKYRRNIKEKLYSYGNVKLLGLIIFMTIPTLINVFLFVYDFALGYHQPFNNLILEIKDDVYIFIVLVFPIAVILTILMTISNIKLLKKEGTKWTNMLGTILGGFLCLATLVATLLGMIMFSNSYLNIISYVVMIFTAYLECIFCGMCIHGFKSAVHIPKFDKDAIIILGCRIRNDGTVTNLLKARVDRAIEFSKMQKEKTGKDIIFVPSGGKGTDEIISEAQAMKSYLLEQGINEANILIEDKSKTTFENIKFSNDIIKNKIEDAKIAFSTTNYHVFRAGIIASKQNIDIEGIGAKTKTYYWVNAFIREFIATLVSEKKSNIKTLIILNIIVIILSVLTSI